MGPLFCAGDIRRERHGFVTAYFRSELALDKIVCALHPHSLSNGDKLCRETLKRSPKSWTYRVGDWVVKEGRPQHGLGVLKHTLQRGRYRRAWDAACFLFAEGVPTPEPIAYLEYGVLGLIWKNALVVRYLEGFRRSDHYAAGLAEKGASESEIGDFFRCLADAIKSLCAAGVYHSDLTGKNILTKDGRSFQFIDLDAVHLGKEYTLARRMRNHVQLYDTFLEWFPDEVLRDLIAMLALPESDFDAWMRGVREARQRRRARAEAIWRKEGRPEIP